MKHRSRKGHAWPRRSSRGAVLVVVLVLTGLLAILAATQMRTLTAGQQLARHARQGEQALQMAQLALRQCEQLALQGGPVPEPADPPRWSSVSRWLASPEVVTVPLPSGGGAPSLNAQCLIENIALWNANPPPHCTPSTTTPCTAGTQPPWSRAAAAGRTVTARVTAPGGVDSTATGTWLQSTLMLRMPGGAARAPVSSEPLQVTHRSWRTLLVR